MSLLHRHVVRRHSPSVTSTGNVVKLSTLGLGANDPLTIPSTTVVIMDVDSASLGAVDIFGALVEDGSNATRNFTAASIVVENGGLLRVGTEIQPYVGGKFTFTLTGAYVPLSYTTINGFQTLSNPGTSRAIMVMPGGTLDLHGQAPTVAWTQLNANAAPGATSLTTSTATGWPSGANFVIAPSDFVDYQQAEQRTLSGAASGTTLSLTAGLTNARWGQLQYPTDSGISLTPGTFSALKADPTMPTVLDERPRIILLDRNIVVQGANDTDWSNKGHGVHVMAMATNGAVQARMRLDSMQVLRGGQRGAIGRYPIHWHVMSLNAGTGATTSNVPSVLGYARNCVVWSSENRGITVHATNGLDIANNAMFDTNGHAFFMEDGSEENNTVNGNMVVQAKRPSLGAALPGSLGSISGTGSVVTVNWTAHGLYSGESISVSGSSVSGYNVFRAPATVVNANQFTYPGTGSGAQSGATFIAGNDVIKSHDNETSGYWITNPNNNFGNVAPNYAAGCPNGSGAWLSFATQCFGFSALSSINPSQSLQQILKSFICHSNAGFGIKTADAPTDEAGDIAGSQKYPQGSGGDGAGHFTFTDHVLFKNSSGAYRNVTNVPIYQRWTVADNGTSDWSGSTNNGGSSTAHLGFGYSLNSASGGYAFGHDRELNDLNQTFAALPRSAFVSYHGTVRFQNCTWFNYPGVAPVYLTAGSLGQGGGMSFGGGDFYDIAGVDRTQGLNDGMKFFNAHPGVMTPPVHLDGRTIDANSGAQRHWSISQVWLDIDGKYGPAGNYMLPISPGTGLVDAYYLSGAASPADGPTTGLVTCKTTSTKYFGIGWSDVGVTYLKQSAPVNATLNQASFTTLYSRLDPLTVTRQDPSLGTTIGTPFMCKRADTSTFNNGYHTAELQNGGRFQVDFSEVNSGVTFSIASPCVCTFPNGANHGLTAGAAIVPSTTGALPTGITAGTTYFVIASGLTANQFEFSTTAGGAAVNTSGTQSGTHSYSFTIDPPDTMLAVDVYVPGTAVQGDFLLLGLPWNNASPRVFVGGSFSNELEANFNQGTGGGSRNSAASAADISGNNAYQASTSAASIAAVLADITGQSYFNDTANKRIWVRWTNRNNAGSAMLNPTTQIFGVQRYTIVVKV